MVVGAWNNSAAADAGHMPLIAIAMVHEKFNGTGEYSPATDPSILSQWKSELFILDAADWSVFAEPFQSAT